MSNVSPIICIRCKNISDNEIESKIHDKECKNGKYGFGYTIDHGKKIWQITDLKTNKVIISRFKRGNALSVYTKLTGIQNVGY